MPDPTVDGPSPIEGEQDDSSAVIALIRDAAASEGAIEGTIAYILKQGLDEAIIQRGGVEDAHSVIAAVGALNQLVAFRHTRVLQTYDQIRQSIPEDLRSNVTNLLIFLRINTQNVFVDGYNINNGEVGGLVSMDRPSGTACDYIFRHPGTGEFVSFSLNISRNSSARVGRSVQANTPGSATQIILPIRQMPTPPLPARNR